MLVSLDLIGRGTGTSVVLDNAIFKCDFAYKPFSTLRGVARFCRSVTRPNTPVG